MTNLFKKTSLWKIVLAVEILIACIFSIGYHQWDEYFQITEFTSYKLGITEANHLAWEYKAQIRPWIHPGINVCIVYLASKLHITDRFNHAFLFRLFAGILAFAALSFFISSLRFYLAEKRNFLWPLFALTAFVPYLMVRPSSEMMSASFILLGVASFLRLGILPNARKIIQPYLSSSLFITGIFLGLAFDFRYQTGVIALALFLWILFFVPSLKHKILDNLFLSFGLFASIGLGLLIDAWGYGQWTLTPWNYLESNLIKGVAASMGTKPFYSFLFLSAQGPLAPFILFVILINLLFWIRYPKHLFTWLTVSFFLLHSAIAHKEGRFLYPVVYLSIANGFFFLTLNEPSYFLNSFFESVKERLLIFYGSRWFLPSFIFNLLGLIFLLFSPIKEEIRLQKYINDHLDHSSSVYFLGSNPYYANFFDIEHRFYRPDSLRLIKLNQTADLSSLLFDKKVKDVFLILESKKLDQTLIDSVSPNKKIEVLYESFPSWLLRFNYFHWVDRTRFWTLYHITDR